LSRTLSSPKCVTSSRGSPDQCPVAHGPRAGGLDSKSGGTRVYGWDRMQPPLSSNGRPRSTMTMTTKYDQSAKETKSPTDWVTTTVHQAAQGEAAMLINGGLS
jgi:hypothetical protein